MARNGRFEPLLELNGQALAGRLGAWRVEAVYFGVLGRSWWRNYLHAHSFFEVCCAVEGEGVFQINEVNHEVRGGDLFVARPGEGHEIVPSQENVLGICFWAFALQRDAGRGADEIDAMMHRLAHGPIHQITQAAGAIKTLELLADEMAERKIGRGLALERLWSKLLLDTARLLTEGLVPLGAERPSRPASAAPPAMATALQYLKDNLARPIEVRDLASQVSLSERHVSRLFQKHLGESVVDCLTRLRLEEAQRLLKEQPDLPIKAIARTCGYPDVRYFTTLFGKRCGMTPARWRASAGGQALSENSNGPR